MAVLAIAGSVACSRRKSLPAGDRDLNVLVITLDTIRADGLGAYGISRVQTDFVDALAIMDADENVDFDVRHLNLVDKGEPALCFLLVGLLTIRRQTRREEAANQHRFELRTHHRLLFSQQISAVRALPPPLNTD